MTQPPTPTKAELLNDSAVQQAREHAWIDWQALHWINGHIEGYWFRMDSQPV
jgi:hypothetical protein